MAPEEPSDDETTECPKLFGELGPWPRRTKLTAALIAGGFTVSAGRYAVRIRDLSHFVFDDYGTKQPVIDADADSVEEMLRDGARVSAALTKAGMRHRFEVYDADRVLRGYFHHLWPLLSSDVHPTPLPPASAP
jgi:hypothetical protein